MRLKVNVRRWRWVFSLCFQEATLKRDDVFAQSVVFGLDDFVGFIKDVGLPNLILESFDMAFFALAECPLN